MNKNRNNKNQNMFYIIITAIYERSLNSGSFNEFLIFDKIRTVFHTT